MIQNSTLTEIQFRICLDFFSAIYIYIYKGQSRNVLLGIVYFGMMIWLSCTQEMMRPSLSLHAMTTPLKKY